jgi:small subunit ribosomal protein S1
VTDFGVFVELQEGIEGLIHLSELSKEKGANPLSQYKTDDVIEAKVLNVSRKDKKIALSVKKLHESTDKDPYKSYVNNKEEATSNLGELLKKGMAHLEGDATQEGGPESEGD